MDRSFRPRPPRYGTQIVQLRITLPTSPATANGTETHRIGAPVAIGELVGSKSVFLGAALSAGTIGVDADGTLLAYIMKRDASTDTDVTLTSSLSLESDGITANEQADFTNVTTLTDAQLTFDLGDVAEIDIVSNSAVIDTQPADVVVVLEFALLE